MKKSLILFFSLILIVGYTYNQYIKKKEIYTIAFKKMSYNKKLQYYERMFIDYFLDSLECPVNVISALEMLRNNPDSGSIVKLYLTDHLSNRDSLIHYFPLYNRTNLKREAFLIISAGIDGKINSTCYNKKDTVYLDEFKEHISFYNVSAKEEEYCEFIDSSFNVLDYMLGDKDYLIQYVNCISFLKEQSIFSLERIIKMLESKRVSFKFIGFKGRCIKKETGVYYFSHQNYNIRCELYDKEKSGIYQEGDNVRIVGILDNFDIKNKVINFKGCFVLK